LLGGEGPLSPSSVAGNHFILTQYAQQYNALIVAVEHRFYGDSVPFNDSSTPNLRYLTTLQALADFANFRASLPFQPGMQFLPSNATWIVFGGSYSGSLSAWARLKYPHLFQGSLAASAPVHAQTDFPEYFEVVTTSIGPECTKAMAAGTSAIEHLLTFATGRDQLQRYFNTCTPIITDDDVATFMDNLASVVSGVVQYNRDNSNYMPEDMETKCHLSLLQRHRSGLGESHKPIFRWYLHGSFLFPNHQRFAALQCRKKLDVSNVYRIRLLPNRRARPAAF
jgi:pimeloyl-ACP methyl ester carboxylesterase